MEEVNIIQDEKSISHRPRRIIGLKMMFFGKIIVPLIIGILITTLITMYFIYVFNPIWVNNSSKIKEIIYISIIF